MAKVTGKELAIKGAKTRFVSGDPRQNKKGRPHTLPNLNEILARVLGEVNPKTGLTATDRIIEKLKELAYKGDKRAAEMLIERGYGKIVQGMDIRTNQEIVAPIINVYTGAAPALAQSEDKVDENKKKE